MPSPSRHPGAILADALGLSGAWVPNVAHNALGSRNVRLPSAVYFLHWDRFGVTWLEGEQGPDSRIPPEAYWIQAYRFADHRPARELVKSEEGLETHCAFRAFQEFSHREALLRQVGFHQWEGRFYLMECVPTDITWEWK